MPIIGKLRTAARVFSAEGVNGIVSVLISQYGLPIPRSAKSKWKAGIKSELQYWDDYFRTDGLGGPDTPTLRCDPKRPLQPRITALLPPSEAIAILDVGAGPLTCLGMQCKGKRVTLTAIDPLADEYDRILQKYQVRPPVRTQKLSAENLTQRFQPNTFDLVYARNCIDHAYNPERAILQMIDVVKGGRYVLLEHRPNEAENEGYYGLHQWNFSADARGDFIIGSKGGRVNMTGKYSELCAISCKTVSEGTDGDYLITTIQKK